GRRLRGRGTLVVGRALATGRASMVSAVVGKDPVIAGTFPASVTGSNLGAGSQKPGIQSHGSRSPHQATRIGRALVAGWLSAHRCGVIGTAGLSGQRLHRTNR